MLRNVDAAAPKPDELAVPDGTDAQAGDALSLEFAGLPERLLEELWVASEAEACGLSLAEFGSILAGVGAKHNFGIPAGVKAGSKEREAFFLGLHLGELALAHGCARGKEEAWVRFLRLYRWGLTQAATAITGSASLGAELADSLYAELYGLRANDGDRRSPFASYSGRGSLQGWLRTTLVQRFRDHHRRTHRESPLEEIDCAAPIAEAPADTEMRTLTDAVARTLGELEAADRFLLAAYFLDRQTLKEIALTLQVHEATISRRLKRLAADVRKNLIGNLRRSGMSRRAAEEALGVDVRDLEINLRSLLQSSQIAAFHQGEARESVVSGEGGVSAALD
ncbi:MAG TPA: sigma-70 family RNA polymerase sigma factor [Terracidiphilus sp.]|jgi:RNA polymerase sigma-70 factor (ECF subfamily)|nr:sigma-70 family RNA polymerase sigma factor [Terracidiphilus sp.]